MHTHTPGQTPPPKDAAGDAAGKVGVEGQGQGERKTVLWLDFCARAVSSAAVAGSLGGGREEGETGEGAALSQGLAGEERAGADAGAVLEETGERGGGVCAHWLRSDKVQEEVRASRTYMDNLGNVTTTTLPYTPGGCFCTCWHGAWCISPVASSHSLAAAPLEAGHGECGWRRSLPRDAVNAQKALGHRVSRRQCRRGPLPLVVRPLLLTPCFRLFFLCRMGRRRGAERDAAQVPLLPPRFRYSRYLPELVSCRIPASVNHLTT